MNSYGRMRTRILQSAWTTNSRGILDIIGVRAPFLSVAANRDPSASLGMTDVDFYRLETLCSGCLWSYLQISHFTLQTPVPHRQNDKITAVDNPSRSICGVKILHRNLGASSMASRECVSSTSRLRISKR